MLKKCSCSLLVLSTIALSGLVSCGSSGGGDGASNTDTVIEGTLASNSSSTTSKVLGADQGGIAGVTIAALGDSQTTDENGNFNLTADGNSFSGGPVQFSVTSDTVNGDIIFDDVAGGPGTKAFVDIVITEDGDITGISSDAAGNILSEVTAGGNAGCTNFLSFRDGGGNNLWKPQSESTGTVVILMPGSFRNADFQILNANGDQAASILRRSCCNHNAGRDHVYLSRNASSLAGEALPLTVRYDFGNGRVECLEVDSPTSRLD